MEQNGKEETENKQNHLQSSTWILLVQGRPDQCPSACPGCLGVLKNSPASFLAT